TLLKSPSFAIQQWVVGNLESGIGSWELGVGNWPLLDSPSAARHRLEADTASDGRGDDPELRHDAVELRREHRLCAIAQGVIGIVVDLDDEAVTPGGHGRARHRRHLVAL